MSAPFSVCVLRLLHSLLTITVGVDLYETELSICWTQDYTLLHQLADLRPIPAGFYEAESSASVLFWLRIVPLMKK